MQLSRYCTVAPLIAANGRRRPRLAAQEVAPSPAAPAPAQAPRRRRRPSRHRWRSRGKTSSRSFSRAESGHGTGTRCARGSQWIISSTGAVRSAAQRDDQSVRAQIHGRLAAHRAPYRGHSTGTNVRADDVVRSDDRDERHHPERLDDIEDGPDLRAHDRAAEQLLRWLCRCSRRAC